MSDALQERLTDAAEGRQVAGAAVGVVRAGQRRTAFTGVTSVTNPLPLDDRTLFQIGSVSKTYAAAAVMRLISEGRVALDDPVQRHVPEFHLRDEAVAEAVTVRHLLNHTSGFDGTRTSGGSDPAQDLAGFVATMDQLDQLSPLGHRVEYNNAGMALAGRIVEKLTRQSYPDAIRSLLFEPLGMHDSHFTRDDLMTRRCTVGHVAGDDGALAVATPWRWPRAAEPEGGIVSTVADQLTWAQYHLTGATASGEQVLAPAERTLMREPTAELVGNAIGDGVGLGWFLRDYDGTTALGHPGATNGQYAELRIVPDRDYAVIALASGPDGPELTRELVDRCLATDLDLRPAVREPRPYDPARDGEVAGVFENNLSRVTVRLDDGVVTAQFALQPEAAAEMPDQPAEFPPGTVDFLPGERGEYVIGDGGFAGSTGSFGRDADGTVTEIDFGGRWHRRTASG